MKKWICNGCVTPCIFFDRDGLGFDPEPFQCPVGMDKEIVSWQEGTDD